MKCNGVANCDDWSDEIPADCNDCKLRDGVTKCDDSLVCMWDEYFCDEVPHCLDNSDESDCNIVCGGSDTFWCEDRTTCISLTATCNGLNECADGSDETPDLCEGVDLSGKFR